MTSKKTVTVGMGYTANLTPIPPTNLALNNADVMKSILMRFPRQVNKKGSVTRMQNVLHNWHNLLIINNIGAPAGELRIQT
jgi:hypothetical protein